MEIKARKSGNNWLVGNNDFIYCNTRYHSPWIATLTGLHEKYRFERDYWDAEYEGYGKDRTTFRIVPITLQRGDIFQVNGGSGSNKYPKIYRVINWNTQTGELECEEISELEAKNALSNNAEESQNKKAKALIRQLLKITDVETAKAVIDEVQNETL